MQVTSFHPGEGHFGNSVRSTVLDGRPNFYLCQSTPIAGEYMEGGQLPQANNNRGSKNKKINEIIQVLLLYTSHVSTSLLFNTSVRRLYIQITML